MTLEKGSQLRTDFKAVINIVNHWYIDKLDA
jgi:hypothetical protein